MRKLRLPFKLFSGLLFAAIGHTAFGQWQTSGTTGLLLPPTTKINVGTTFAAPSLLTVSGDQLNSGETFRTVSPGGTNNFWRMFKGNANEIGAIWNEGYHRAWHVQSLEQRDATSGNNQNGVSCKSAENYTLLTEDNLGKLEYRL
jgi:hypothetical protein